MSTSAITPLKFTGVSTFSSDLQTILTRAVSIANLPVQALQNDQATNLAKKTSLGSLSSIISDLGAAVKSLGQIGDSSALAVSSSDSSLVSVVNNGLTTPVSYTISNITSVAAAASETTASGFATADTTPVNGDGKLELVLGSTTYPLDVSKSNNLNALATAINNSGAGVTATVLNTGSVANPYYLSLTNSATGATTLQLRTTAGDASTNILTSVNQGANAVFQLNGLPVSKPDNVVSDVIPNLTLTIEGTTAQGQSVALTAASSRTSLANALQQFVTTYNGLGAARDSQIGQGAGVLSGDNIVQQVSSTLRAVSGFQDASGTSIKSLADLGIELDKTGTMSFNSDTFNSLSSTQITDAYHFFRSSAGGFGSLSSNFDSFTDPTSGLIQSELNQFDNTDKRLTDQISVMTDRINLMQNSLSLQLSQADSMLASLQQEQNLINASYASFLPSLTSSTSSSASGS